MTTLFNKIKNYISNYNEASNKDNGFDNVLAMSALTFRYC